jgi:23S rRNA (uracil1939-C5)-methyltransferase
MAVAMPEQGQIRLRIEKLVAGGEALAFHEGKAVFLPFALPGETVLARIAGGKRDYARAELVEVLEPSPLRIEPPCPIYGECGGCNLQHLEYGGQVEAKARIVAESFARLAKLETGAVEAAPSRPFAYRNRMQLHYASDGSLGLKRRSSSDIVAAPSCLIALDPIREWMGSAAARTRPRPAGEDRFLVFGYGEEVWVEGEADLAEVEVAGERLRFRVGGFFQSNLGLLEALVPEAIAGLSGGRAADLYCGVGVFGRFLSRSFGSLTCVEEDPGALELARANAPGPGNEYFPLAVEDWVRTESALRPFDLVLVDPPRTGLAPSAREWLARSKPATIVYVSCDPVTLARDSRALVEAGYALQRLKAFDFYPQTSHVECYARFVLR